MEQASALNELLEELQRIEGQQGRLQTAVNKKQGIVVHPRREVCLCRCKKIVTPTTITEKHTEIKHSLGALQVLFAEEEEPQSPQAPKTLLKASGGLTGFGVAQASCCFVQLCELASADPVCLTLRGTAQDLLRIDFSTPEEAPEQFRAIAFDAKEVVEIRPGLSGLSQLLAAYLLLSSSSAKRGHAPQATLALWIRCRRNCTRIWAAWRSSSARCPLPDYRDPASVDIQRPKPTFFQGALALLPGARDDRR